MTKTIRPSEARQGRWGTHVLTILIVALALAGIVWAATEFYGETTETPQTQTGTGAVE